MKNIIGYSLLIKKWIVYLINKEKSVNDINMNNN